MRVLGIDPGTVTTGYGIIDSQNNKLIHIENGGLFAKGGEPLHKRLQSIYSELKTVLNRYRPDAVVLEEVFLANNVRSALHLGQARGVVLLAIAEDGIPYFEYSTKEIKKSVVGYGNASKEQVQIMIKNLLKLKDIVMFDAADALAAAICHIHSSGITKQLEKQLPYGQKRRRICHP